MVLHSAHNMHSAQRRRDVHGVLYTGYRVMTNHSMQCNHEPNRGALNGNHLKHLAQSCIALIKYSQWHVLGTRLQTIAACTGRGNNGLVEDTY